MSRLLEILGRGLNLDVADLIWNWLDACSPSSSDGQSPPSEQCFDKLTTASEVEGLNKVIELIRKRRTDSAADQLRLYLFDNPNCPRGRLASAAISIGKLLSMTVFSFPVSIRFKRKLRSSDVSSKSPLIPFLLLFILSHITLKIRGSP